MRRRSLQGAARILAPPPDAGELHGGTGVQRGGAGVLHGCAGVLDGGAGVLHGGAGILDGGAGVLHEENTNRSFSFNDVYLYVTGSCWLLAAVRKPCYWHLTSRRSASLDDVEVYVAACAPPRDSQ